jgi:surface antigen
MPRLNAALLPMVTALALGGCDVTSGSGEGGGMIAGAFSGTPAKPASPGPSDNAAAAAVTDAALGGLLGNKLGAALDESDRRLAYHAQIEALDHGAPGAPVPWRNPISGRYGNIVTGPLYDRKGAKCRGFSHTVTINGELETARGTACRNSEGGWTNAG